VNSSEPTPKFLHRVSIPLHLSHQPAGFIPWRDGDIERRGKGSYAERILKRLPQPCALVSRPASERRALPALSRFPGQRLVQDAGGAAQGESTMRNVDPNQVCVFAADGSTEDRETVEPNADIACNWWPDITNVWTPIGWPSHLFRFNVVYDGAIIAHPVVSPVGQLKPHVEPYAGQGVQLTFIPSPSPYLGLGAINLSTHGYAETTFPYAGRAPRVGNQGWNETPAPLLWSEWRREGLVLRQEIFAHVSGGGEVETGIEPLFCWIRLSIHDAADGCPFDTYGFQIIVNACHTVSGEGGGVLHVNPKHLAYPRVMSMEAAGNEEERGFRLVEPDGRIRLAVVDGQN